MLFYTFYNPTFLTDVVSGHRSGLERCEIPALAFELKTALPLNHISAAPLHHSLTAPLRSHALVDSVTIRLLLFFFKCRCVMYKFIFCAV